MPGENATDGLGDVRGREDGEGYLVKKRLKDVVVAAVNDGEIDGQFAQRAGCVDSCEASADDDDARTCAGNSGSGELAQSSSSPGLTCTDAEGGLFAAISFYPGG